MKHIEVVAAVFKDEENRIYCTQRGDKGELAFKWEFPGGKIEEGETKEDALTREIQEELSVDIVVDEYITTVHHRYSTFELTMHAYYTYVVSGAFVLCEHINAKWLKREDLLKLDWAPADIPIVMLLIEEDE